MALIALILLGLATLAHWHAFSAFASAASGFIEGAWMIAGFVILFGYGIIYEIRWNGQTPGKKMLGLRVMRDGGYPVNVFGVIIRNLLRAVDFLPMAYFAGTVAIIATSDYQRLGDLVGGTIVVKQRAPQTLEGLLRIAHITPEHLDRNALEHIMGQAGLDHA